MWTDNNLFCYLAGEELPSNGVSGEDNVFEDSQPFPPPPPSPPSTEISLLEVPPKTPPSAEAFQINELDIWPNVTAMPVQVFTDNGHESQTNQPLQNGQALNKTSEESPPSPSSVKEIAPPPPSPSVAKGAPPLPTKPKPKL